MNIKTIILIILIPFISLAQKQGKAYYSKTSSLEFAPSSIYKNTNKDIANMEFVLTFNDSLASYVEINNGVASKSNTIRLSRTFSGYNGPYYYNFITKEASRVNSNYIITKSINSYNWRLLKDKLIINNLNCYKATTTLKVETRSGIKEREVTAWYTTDININLGPDGFTGLPGLIIQLEYEKVVTTLKRIDFNNKNTTINIPTKGKRVTEAEFSAIIKELNRNRTN